MIKKMYKCSSNDLKKYHKKIQEYLKSKSVVELKNYEAHIESDKLVITRWNYPDIEKPNITLDMIRNINDHEIYDLSYVELFTRALYFDVSSTQLPIGYMFNARGIEATQTTGECIEGFLGLDIFIHNKYLFEESGAIAKCISLKDGLFQVRQTINRNLMQDWSGKFRIIFPYSKRDFVIKHDDIGHVAYTFTSDMLQK